MDYKGWNEKGISFEEAANKFYKIYKTIDEMPRDLLDGIERGLDKKESLDWLEGKPVDPIYVDVATPLKNGKKWVFDKMKSYQPLTYEILMQNGSELMVGHRLYENPDPENLSSNLYLFLVVHERCIFLNCQMKEMTLENGVNPEDLLTSLPTEIAHSYYWRISGWEIPLSIPSTPMQQRQLPSNVCGNWDPIEFNQYHKDDILKFIENIYIPKENIKNIRIILDTRPIGYIKTGGTQIMIYSDGHNPTLNGVMFVIPKIEDLSTALLLNDPIAAFDQYCVHTLVRKSTQFDFIKFCKPLNFDGIA